MNPKAPHRFSRPAGDFFQQLDNPSGSLNPVYSQVKNGIDMNHGWKIHADLVTDLSKDEGLAKMGRGADLSIIDQDLADAFDQRLGKLGLNFDDFNKFYGTAYQMYGDPGMPNRLPRYADPNDIVSASEVFDRHNSKYKMGLAQYGEGRHITAYPQSLENRDSLIKSLEDTLGNRLVDQNDPAYRATLKTRDTGVKNHPLSRGVSGRFTTDYLDSDPTTGKVDFSLSNETGNVPDEYKISGAMNPEQINNINKVTEEMPEMRELLHGKDGYVSPYKTIEQIAEERSTGKIALSFPGMFTAFEGTSIDEYNGRVPLPQILKNGQTQTMAPPAPQPVARAPQPAAPAPATIHGQPADQVPKHLGGTLEPGAAIPQNIPQQPTLPPHLTGQTAPAQPVTPRPQPAATVTPRRQIPLGQPVQAAAPTSAPTAAPTATTKPVGRPVISVTASPPPPTGAGAQQASAQVTQTGNATPKPVAKVTATVQNTPPPPAKVVTSGAPTPKPLLKKTGDDISKALLGGTKGTRNIKLAGAAALLGLGAYTVNKKSHQTNDDYDRKLEMQRRGMMM